MKDMTVLSYAQYRPSDHTADKATGERKSQNFEAGSGKTIGDQIADFLAEGAAMIGSHVYSRSEIKICTLPIGY